jgi:hypothetical protein
VAAA